MKLTKETLKQIIKEELEAVMNEGAELTDEKHLKIEILTSVLGDGKDAKKQLKGLETLLYYIQRPFGPRYEDGIERAADNLPFIKAKRDFNLKDEQTVNSLIAMHKRIMKNPKETYETLFDDISQVTQGDQIHKMAKEKFGDVAGASGQASRSFMQKAGSFLTGKGFKEE